MEIREQLIALNFSEKEIEIYLTILKLGKVSVADLARLTNIQRTTVYSNLKNLIANGFVIEELGGTKSFFMPGSQEAIRDIYKVEQEALEKKRQLVESVIVESRKIQNTGFYNPPKIRFVPEEQIESFLYEQSPVWIESIIKTDKTWWGFQDHLFVEVYQDWIDWFWTQAPEELDLKLLSNESRIEEEMKKKSLARRVIRYWDGKEFTATVWVVGDYIVTLSLQNHPYHVVQFLDPLLAQNLRNLFSDIWERKV